MNLFELFVKIGVDDQASGKLKDLGGKLGNGLKTAAKIGTAAVGAAAAGITALTTAAVKNYAEYEQLVGGVDTLFKDASQKVQQYAADAYKTAGMSANDYMENATAFSASLISSLGGDTEKAAEYANRAMVSMSDNANKMGTSLDSIVQTYQSLSRGNMAMLDNLKLGYGGTKAELERLIADAASYTDIQKEMGVTVDASSMSFDNIVNAISVVQGKLGIAGATAAEASTTIEGSVNSMKASWQNLLTSFIGTGLSLEDEIENFVNSVSTVYDNIAPRIEIALDGAVQLIEGLFPKIAEKLPKLVGSLLPSIVNGAVSIVQSFVNSIADNGDLLVQSAIDSVMTLSNGILNMLPEIIKLGLDLIVSLALGIANSLPTLIPTIIDVVLQIVNTLTSPEMLTNLINAGIQLVIGLVNGLVAAIPKIIDAIPTIITNLITALLDNIPLLIGAGIKLIVALVSNIPAIIVGLAKAIPQIIAGLIDAIIKFVPELGKTGLNLIKGLWEGIKDAGKWLWDKISGFFSGIVDGIKGFFGIHSPSRLFRDEIGKMLAKGIGVGFDDEFAHVKDDMEDALNFDDASVGINASIRKVGAEAAGMAYGGVSYGDINIYVNGDKHRDENALAEALAVKLQRMTERKSAVYA
jgi:phage-related protein